MPDMQIEMPEDCPPGVFAHVVQVASVGGEAILTFLQAVPPVQPPTDSSGIPSVVVARVIIPLRLALQLRDMLPVPTVQTGEKDGG